MSLQRIRTRRIYRRYPIVDGRIAVEVKLAKLEYLFDERDPSPLHVKDLDDDFVDYVESSFSEIPDSLNAQLILYLESGEYTEDQLNEAESAIRSFFEFEAEECRKLIQRKLKKGLKSLMIGLSFLLFAVWVSYVGVRSGDKFLNKFIEEGFLLLGWVSMWNPINVFLYEWWPFAETRNAFLNISKTMIQFRTNTK